MWGNRVNVAERNSPPRLAEGIFRVICIGRLDFASSRL